MSALLYQQIAGFFGAQDIYKDTGNLDDVEICQVFLVLIGPQWLNRRDLDPKTDLENPADTVRLEIQKAMVSRCLIIPVLLGNARLPLAEELPESLASLCHYQEIKVRPEPYWRMDVQRLIMRLEEVLIDPEPSGVTEDSLNEMFQEVQESRYFSFITRGRGGRPEDVDFLMKQLISEDIDLASTRLVDYTLGLIKNQVGMDRIRWYLFHGKPIQRNYAALFFKRRGHVAILEEAVRAGAVDREQAFSK